MSHRRTLCQCTHSDLAHSFHGWCRVFDCFCEKFTIKARLIKAERETSTQQQQQCPQMSEGINSGELNHLEKNNSATDIATAAFEVINQRLGFTVKWTEQGIIASGYIGGGIVNCRRVDPERISATGQTLAEALAKLIAEAKSCTRPGH